MTPRLSLLCCAGFAAEFRGAVAALNRADIDVASFPVRCGRPPVDAAELRALLPDDAGDAVALGNACLHCMADNPAGFPGMRTERVAQCFDLVAGQQIVADALAARAYLVTPSWLAEWPERLRGLGVTPADAPAFFGEFATEVLLLDTGVDTGATAHLAAFGNVVRLPVRRLGVGLDTVRAHVVRLALEWQYRRACSAFEQEGRRRAAQVADNVAALDMLARLATTEREADAVAEIEELFRTLFAPAALHYVSVENDLRKPSATIPEATLAAMLALADEYALTPAGDGFILRIGHGGTTLGIVAAERLAFPAHRERYLNFALALAGVCGLAVANARNRRRLIEMEKMASLAYVVAGVAHEVNTPLGVALTAASTIAQQSRRLAERFAARKMTQSELDQYLAATNAGTGLIGHNLERIGRLVDTFRQVAVERRTADRSSFRLRECVDDVVRSFGARLDPAHVSVTIEVSPDLVVESTRDDWITILVNLVGNSLKHGFRGRAHGAIVIRADAEAQRLHFEYRDDGAGMAPATLARVFDPFFTTDLQSGMGLGMHLVYNLVSHRFSGSIDCASAPGEGVAFRIDVPLHPSKESS